MAVILLNGKTLGVETAKIDLSDLPTATAGLGESWFVRVFDQANAGPNGTLFGFAFEHEADANAAVQAIIGILRSDPKAVMTAL